MSIKTKLALMISLVVAVTLTMNISISYITSEAELKHNAEQQMATIAKQIGSTLEATEKSRNYMEDLVGETLRNVSLAALSELDPHVRNVTNEQLAELSRKLGVDHITLWVRTPDDILAVRSSDPTQIGLSSKTWDYWYTAFQQLFDRKPVTVPQGQKLKDYWSGPIQYSTADSTRIDKWGYYYDGTADYMIDPYVDAKRFLEFEKNNGADLLVRNLLTDNPNILGIAGINPEFFGKPPILKKKNGKLVQNLDVREIVFGDYTYKEGSKDAEAVQRTVRAGVSVSTFGRADGKDIMKSFIPLRVGSSVYVAGVTFDYGAIERVLYRQLMLQICISLGLLLAASAASYMIAGLSIRPLHQIVAKVGEIAQGRFDDTIPIRRRDELGLLSSRINQMAGNLRTYTGKLQDTAEELRGTKEYLESFVGQTSDAIHVTDLAGKVIRVNPAFEKMFGWSADEVLGRPLPIWSVEGDYLEIGNRVQRGEAVADHETVRLTKEGQAVDVSITVSPIRSEDGQIVAIAEIARNITSRKQAEEAIRRSEKLSIVGQLAAGVAHEIRNPLTTVRGFVQLQRQTGKLPESHLDVMLSELDRINLIVGEFLILAKPQAQQFQPVELKTLLSDIILLLNPLAQMSQIRVDTVFDTDIPRINGDANQLKQVFINLLKNGIEAMPDGGTITIAMRTVPEDRAVTVRVADEGVGIPEENMPRVGEPFFTSKPNGNGLGLMVSQRIIAHHKGTLSIQSRAGIGTTVEVKLPAL
ncbi:ATP-binding protein [Cohnella caldifontis]|uniref:ATP-binding protein n=1 Tax=Cohnella caldifontis TaxID=3027471 RepID=UPI0023EC5DF1|nr:ATP-binding protein [Cohnella sp. YIM B05605]